MAAAPRPQGRPRLLNDLQRLIVHLARDDGHTYRSIANHFGVSEMTISHVLNPDKYARTREHNDLRKQRLRNGNRSQQIAWVSARMHGKACETMRAWGLTETDVTPGHIRKLLRDLTHCPLCQVEMVLVRETWQHDQATIDHIKPFNVGGTHTKDNIRIICFRCNRARPLDGSDV